MGDKLPTSPLELAGLIAVVVGGLIALVREIVKAKAADSAKHEEEKQWRRKIRKDVDGLLTWKSETEKKEIAEEAYRRGMDDADNDG